MNTKSEQKAIHKELLLDNDTRTFNWTLGYYSTSKLAVRLSMKLHKKYGSK